MVVYLIQLRWAMIRRQFSWRRALFSCLGVLAALAAVIWTFSLALGATGPVAPVDALALAYAGWFILWLMVPFFGYRDRGLRADYFALLPISRARLTVVLTVVNLVGVWPLVTLLASGALLAFGVDGLTPTSGVAVTAFVFQIAVLATLGRVVYESLGLVMRSRLATVLSATVLAAVIALLAQGWRIVFPTANDPHPTSVRPAAGAISLARALPSGWGADAIDLARQGNFVGAGLMLFLMLALAGLLALLLIRVSRGRPMQPVRSGRPIAFGLSAWLASRFIPTGPLGAAINRELITWSRDLRRLHQWSTAFLAGVFMAVILQIAGQPAILPWIVLYNVAIVVHSPYNLYGMDGSALWMSMSVPGGLRVDVRARQIAWLMVTTPPFVVFAALCAVADRDFTDVLLILALLPAMLGAGSGLLAYGAIRAMVPCTDPIRRGANPLDPGDAGASETRGNLVALLTALASVPALIVLLAGVAHDSRPLEWVGVALGWVIGIGGAVLLGQAAARRLERTAPEMLQVLSVRGQRVAPRRTQDSRVLLAFVLRVGIVLLLWLLFWIPLYAGIGSLLRRTTGDDVPGWALLDHSPAALQLPMAIFLIAIGCGMVALGVVLPRRLHRPIGAARQAESAPMPTGQPPRGRPSAG